jgi:hypothetical protein
MDNVKYDKTFKNALAALEERMHKVAGSLYAEYMAEKLAETDTKLKEALNHRDLFNQVFGGTLADMPGMPAGIEKLKEEFNELFVAINILTKVKENNGN